MEFEIEFSIKRQTPPLMNKISIHFLPHFFLMQLNLTYIKRILHLVSVKNITFKSPHNWFKIDNLGRLRPLTAIFSTFQLSHIHNIKLKLCAKSVVFKQKKSEKNLMELETPPPPFMENSIKNFHFVFSECLPYQEKPSYLCLSKVKPALDVT